MTPRRQPKPRKGDAPLFESEPSAEKAPKRKKRHLYAVEIPRQSTLNLDGAPLYYSKDSLLLRCVQPHSAQKARQVFRGLDTVSLAMSKKPFGTQYVEFYSGPGMLLDDETSEELDGSPKQALSVRRPFDRYVFSDLSETCTAALTKRIGHLPNVYIETGNANDPTHIDRIIAKLDPRALTIVYLDPANPSHLLFKTVQYLSKHLRFMDLIINVPVHGLRRAVLGAGERFEGTGAAGAFLNHPQPRVLMRGYEADIVSAVRNWYDEQLMGLGFMKPARRTVAFGNGSPYYDILYCSRHPVGVRLWNKTNPDVGNPQMRLIGGEFGA